MFEHHSEPLATPAEFAQRMLRYSLVTAGIIVFSLVIGILGYHYFESLSWIDFESGALVSFRLCHRLPDHARFEP